jgi:uncharacterized protein DUF5908
VPVEIKELVIRTVVSDADTGDEESGRTGGGATRPGDATNTGEIVQECVRQVLRVLKTDRRR